MLEEITLLYVEDDKVMQEYVKDLLKDEVNEFLQAYNGKEAIDIYKEKKPHIILSDINMPIMDGFEMTKELKKIDSQQIIIFFTALTDIKDLKKAIDLHIDGFINKPLTDIEDFLNYIKSKVDLLKFNILQKELKETKLEKQKLNFILKTIREISHHWRQPLNSIALYTSALTYKKENHIKIDEKDFKNLEKVTDLVKKLSSVLKDIESIDHDKSTNINTVSNLIKISNPIYE